MRRGRRDGITGSTGWGVGMCVSCSSRYPVLTFLEDVEDGDIEMAAAGEVGDSFGVLRFGILRFCGSSHGSGGGGLGDGANSRISKPNVEGRREEEDGEGRRRLLRVTRRCSSFFPHHRGKPGGTGTSSGFQQVRFQASGRTAGSWHEAWGSAWRHPTLEAFKRFSRNRFQQPVFRLPEGVEP